jgi:outer membrane lipoprotein-sorting protein
MAGFRQQMKEHAAQLESIQCTFTQEKTLQALSDKIVSKGDFWFKKPGKVRMEYTSPFHQLLIINNNKILMKDDHKSNQFSARSNKLFQQINNIILGCIQGTILESKNFSSSVYESKEQFLLTMQPLSKDMKSFFQRIEVTINKKDHSIEKLTLTDPANDNTQMIFHEKKINQPVPETLFQLK